MKILIQRVTQASVSVEGCSVAEISQGILALACVEIGDTQAEADWLAKKLCALRIFPSENHEMDQSIRDKGGEVLVVSQFTLAADLKKGNRPRDSPQGWNPHQARGLTWGLHGYYRYKRVVFR